MWKGAITFGLVNVPVKAYAATQDHDVPLHQVHDTDQGRIRYQRRCEVCGQVVPFEHIDRAFDDGERMVVLTSQDFESLPAERSREIEVVEFVPSDQIDPMLFDRSYFLEPDSKSNKAYTLLLRTLDETDRTAVVKCALRQRTRLAALRVHDDVLVLQTLLWADEVRSAQFPALESPAAVSAKEMAMSAQLVASFEGDFAPEEYADEYQAQLRELIDAKIDKGEAFEASDMFGDEPQAPGGDVIDLMEALRRSVAQARGGTETAKSGGSPADEEADQDADQGKPAGRRRARKKAPA